MFLFFRFQRFCIGLVSSQKNTVQTWQNSLNISTRCHTGEQLCHLWANPQNTFLMYLMFTESTIVLFGCWFGRYCCEYFAVYLVLIWRCRTRILEQEEPKERERHLMKFIKVMKVIMLECVASQSQLLGGLLWCPMFNLIAYFMDLINKDIIAPFWLFLFVFFT